MQAGHGNPLEGIMEATTRCLTELDFPKESAEHIAAQEEYFQGLSELTNARNSKQQSSIKVIEKEVDFLFQRLMEKRECILRLIGDWPPDQSE